MGAERNSLIKGLRWPARITSQRWISPITDHQSLWLSKDLVIDLGQASIRSCRMMRSHVGAVAAVTGVEAFTAAPLMSGVERFVAAVTLLPVEDTPVEDMQLRDAAMDTAAMDGR